MNIAAPLLNKARSHPDLLAITDAQGSLNFGQFVHRIQCLAAGMVSTFDLQRDDRVILYMENRREFLELLFACWVAGLVAVPTNAKLHPKEVRVIAADSRAKVIMTSQGQLDGLADALSDLPDTPRLVQVESDEYARCMRASPMVCQSVSPTDLAWIFYTSGTTGVPKGAMLSHRNLMMMSLQYAADIDQILPGETMFHCAPLSHGSGLYSLPHLFGGGHQVVEPGFNTDSIFEVLKKYKQVSLFAAPTMLTRLIHASKGIKDPAGNLRTAFYGGSPMYLSDLIKTIEIFGPRLYQLYGQGESPMTITGLSKLEHEGDLGSAHQARLSSCGTARTGVEVRVVDDHGNDVPLGELGEVITRSDTVMSGYWGNEKATQSALRDGWLWTGDIGTLDERGYLTLRDRSKDMIIRGGSNIYPREIEEVLLKHPSVVEVSVVGRPHHDVGEEPVAFVVTKTGESITAEELDQLCLDNIARFKRPREYIFEQSLPKNNYGKILKTELREKLSSGET